MSEYLQDLGDVFLPSNIPLGIKAPGTVAIAEMQSQANRMVATYQPRLSELPIVIDGIVGPKTVAALQHMTAVETNVNTPGSAALVPLTASATTIRNGAASIAAILSSMATSQGAPPAIFAPYLVPAGQPVPPVNAPPGTPGLPPPGLSTTTLMIGAVAVGVAWALLTKKSSRKGTR